MYPSSDSVTHSSHAHFQANCESAFPVQILEPCQDKNMICTLFREITGLYTMKLSLQQKELTKGDGPATKVFRSLATLFENRNVGETWFEKLRASRRILLSFPLNK